MIFIRVKTKLIVCVLSFVLLCSLGFNAYKQMRNTDLKYKHESLVSFFHKADSTRLVSFVASMGTDEQRIKDIEIFDISKGEVIKTYRPDEFTQKQVEKILKSITGIYVKIKPFPDKGHIIRIPLSPSIAVHNGLLNDYGINSVDEVFLLFPGEENPYLLVIDDKYRPHFYHFNEKTDELLKNFDF